MVVSRAIQFSVWALSTYKALALRGFDMKGVLLFHLNIQLHLPRSQEEENLVSCNLSLCNAQLTAVSSHHEYMDMVKSAD